MHQTGSCVLHLPPWRPRRARVVPRAGLRTARCFVLVTCPIIPRRCPNDKDVSVPQPNERQRPGCEPVHHIRWPAKEMRLTFTVHNYWQKASAGRPQYPTWTPTPPANARHFFRRYDRSDQRDHAGSDEALAIVTRDVLFGVPTFSLMRCNMPLVAKSPPVPFPPQAFVDLGISMSQPL